jgi:hypothetical protein
MAPTWRVISDMNQKLEEILRGEVVYKDHTINTGNG